MFGERLRQIRQKVGISQLRLAKDIGVSDTTIQNYEGGQLPKGEHVIKLADRFNVYIDWLLTGEGPQTKETPAMVAEPQAPYENKTKELKRRTDPGGDIGDVVRKVTLIMESDVPDVKTALVQNVDTFYKAIHWAKGVPPPDEGKEEKKTNEGT